MNYIMGNFENIISKCKQHLLRVFCVCRIEANLQPQMIIVIINHANLLRDWNLYLLLWSGMAHYRR